MIKINAETYLQIGGYPSWEMELSGWEVKFRQFLFIPFYIYKKPL